MGISGLIPFVKRASHEVSVKEFSGWTVAVDAYCWLHKGAFSCADKLVKGEHTDGYIHYCMKMVNMLLGNGLKPILVFDGQNLPAKKQTEAKRRENREKNRKKAKEFLREGKLKEARECFQRCVDVTPQMARVVILACRSKGVDCIVAPYEADAQLAYLCKVGIAQLVITEDSDLILFGCEKVLFKMDSGGCGILVEQSQLHLCMGLRAECFTFDKFRHTCILSGCDYLDSLPGIGLIKAAKFFALSSNPNLSTALSRVPSYLRMPHLVVSVEYKEGFLKADNTFLYQLVFCPLQKKLVPLNPYPPGLDPAQMEYAGRYLPKVLAQELAKGNINVSTMESFPEFNNTPKCTKVRQQRWSDSSKPVSIWNDDFRVKKPKPIKTQDSMPIPTVGKVTQVIVPKSLIITPRKRKIDSEDHFFKGPSDQDLLSLYGMENSPPTESTNDSPSRSTTAKISRGDSHSLSPLSERNFKHESNSERNIDDKKPLRNRFCINKSTVSVTTTPIVRSRFFWSSSEKNFNSQTSLLDKFDEDQASPDAITSSATKLTGSGSVARLSQIAKTLVTEASSLTNSPLVKAGFKPVISKSHQFRIGQDELASNDLLTQSQRSTFNLSQSSVVTENDNSQISRNSDRNVLKDRFSYSPSFDSEEPLSQCSTNLSQLSVCSIDKESFGLSQSSQNSELQVDLIVQKQNYMVPEKASNKLKDIPSCRRVGLSKKKTTPKLLSGQLSLKDAFEKFRFHKRSGDSVCSY